jgi:structural maintenance of chromosome 1
LKLKEERARISHKIKTSEKDLEKKKEDQKKQRKEIAKLERELQDVTAALNELNDQGSGGAGTLQLAESQVQEYHKM